MRDAHDTHCCIDHGCKYGDEDCPVATGIRKQCYLCEMCGLETEGYYGKPERTQAEQQEYVDALWEEKHNPRVLTELEQAVAKMAKQYGRSRLIAMINDFSNLGVSEQTVLNILKEMKGIK